MPRKNIGLQDLKEVLDWKAEDLEAKFGAPLEISMALALHVIQ